LRDCANSVRLEDEALAFLFQEALGERTRRNKKGFVDVDLHALANDYTRWKEIPIYLANQ